MSISTIPLNAVCCTVRRKRLILLGEVVEENVRVQSAGEGIDTFTFINDVRPPRLFGRADPHA